MLAEKHTKTDSRVVCPYKKGALNSLESTLNYFN